MIVPSYDFRAITNDVAERRAVETIFAQSAICGVLPQRRKVTVMYWWTLLILLSAMPSALVTG